MSQPYMLLNLTVPVALVLLLGSVVLGGLADRTRRRSLVIASAVCGVPAVLMGVLSYLLGLTIP
ncbi:hypothetical protein QOL99_02230 [Deinococcus sp. MIMF12]|uniref:Major facilitator superfamily (MFS) profile domain-containing protein n=1 Tax=Deinococcus rhizophilus TaxID=3049544 RepID=A0ABT7JD30_9DEIO|nr:hypothetical protein [Deinococcus rhizophilus]MDL2342961.1 hypothetical protein [Deinococcus rhizophilus]